MGQVATRKKSSRASKPGKNAPAITGTFLDRIPAEEPAWADGAATSAVAEAMAEAAASRMVTVVYEVRAEQSCIFQTFGGTATFEETDILPFAGRDRYLLHNRKVRGVTRAQLEELAQASWACSGRDQCGRCTACRIWGWRGKSNDGRSRIQFYDAWSTTAADPLVDHSRTVRGNPFLRHAQVVPPGVTFIGAFALRYPTQDDLAHVLTLAEQAFVAGIGARTTTHGTMRLRPLAFMGGAWTSFGSVWPLLEKIDSGLDSDRATLEVLTEASAGVLPFLAGEEARAAAMRIMRRSPLHPLYGLAPESDRP